MLTDEQIEIRKTGIGGSDIAAVAGLHPYREPLDVYLDKTGGAPPFAGNDATWWGEQMEPVLLAWYSRREGARVDAIGETFRCSERPWQLWTPDGQRTTERIIVECKAPVSWMQWKRWGRAGTEQVPVEVLCQCLWYLDCSGADRCDVVALIGGTPKVFPIKRDEDAQANLFHIGERFWHEHVQAGIPPGKDWQWLSS